MKKLELPVTIRLAKKDEVSNDPSVQENIKAGNKANIVEGYILHSNTSHELTFDFFAEINIDNSKLWQLFHSLTSTLPVHSCLIFGHIDHEPYFTEYEETTKIFNIISKYKKELSQDGYLEFGLLYQDENKLIEVFINKAKYIQYWGTDKDAFTEIISSYSLYEYENINFIDEFPMVTESLVLNDSSVTNTHEIIKDLFNSFNVK